MLKRVPRSRFQNKTINKVYPCAPDLYGTCNRVLSGSNLHENLYEHGDLRSKRMVMRTEQPTKWLRRVR